MGIGVQFPAGAGDFIDFKLLPFPNIVCFLLGNSPAGSYPEENIQQGIFSLP
jgi:hypothetical protein